MGQAKAKKSFSPVGGKTVSSRSPNDPLKTAPPTSNTGGKELTKAVAQESQSGTDRYRINISVPEGVYNCLVAISSATGQTLAQAALSSLMSGLPDSVATVDAVRSMRLAHG